MTLSWSALCLGLHRRFGRFTTGSSCHHLDSRALQLFTGRFRLCGDVAWPRDLTRYRRDKITDARRYPLFGAAYSTVKPCAFWPTRPAEPPNRIGPDNRAASILLVQSTGDVATPHRNAVRVRHLLARNSRLLTLDGMFHPAYLFAESRCIDDPAATDLGEVIAAMRRHFAGWISSGPAGR